MNLHTYLHPRVKGMQNRHLPPLLRFIPQFAQICIIFALSKFEANSFFRPVSAVGEIPAAEMVVPRYSTLSSMKKNLSGLSLRPQSCNRVSTR